ncbi:MAG: hypothetical protein OMM_08526 [Candidatus Magnetoglobus multicellularis str. Araruama]|uniref:Uncharacterized protein n=1 Tax=Candidatus Magnetoglobus multicellularis str. Araruama TaxID=890399 RepID=A0A1V1P7S7_9BACT|nr:MAG: hypothetical protein OMM_08526 [Candidatus Magnetoglobus multicellularis str. Araruama]
MVSEIGWISITTIYPKIYDRLLTDSPKEVQALEQFLRQYPIHMIQWRNLNIDPMWYYTQMLDSVSEMETGMDNLLKYLMKTFPDLWFGFF